MRSIVAVAGLFALALAACGGSSGGPAKTDGSSTDHPADMTGGDAGLGGSGTGAAGHAGAAGAAGGAGSNGAGGGAGSNGAGGGAGAAGGQGGAGQGGAAGSRDGGSDARTDGGGCQSQNPDPCICGRPDANSISATECVREKACRAAGGTWEPYLVFLPEGGSYGPRCQSVDGAAFDAS